MAHTQPYNSEILAEIIKSHLKNYEEENAKYQERKILYEKLINNRKLNQ